jgi:RNA polymerase sigma-70 factor (ECF subfamily)
MSIEQRILEGCKRGERAAQEHLYRHFAPVMLGICLRYTKDKDEAEDVMQEGFIKVFANIDRFREEGSFEGWIKRIMVNTALNHYHKAQKTNTHRNIEDIRETDIIADDAPMPKTRFSQKEMLDAIRELPEGYSTIFNLYVFEKYKHKEIAEMLNISVNTSKSQLAKARIYLKKVLNRMEQEKRGNNER